MPWNFQEIEETLQKDAQGILTVQDFEQFRLKYIGKKGLISQMYSSLGSLSTEERPLVGKKANELKNRVEEILEKKRKEIQEKQKKISVKNLDVTLPGVSQTIGHKHILTQTIDEICGLFEKLGFRLTGFSTGFQTFNANCQHPIRQPEAVYEKWYNPEIDSRPRKLLLTKKGKLLKNFLEENLHQEDPLKKD